MEIQVDNSERLLPPLSPLPQQLIAAANFYHVPFLETFSKEEIKYWLPKFEQHMTNTE